MNIFQIACEAIDVIIPAMKSTSNSKAALQKLSLGKILVILVILTNLVKAVSKLTEFNITLAAAMSYACYHV